jgi:hypothetical protein
VSADIVAPGPRDRRMTAKPAELFRFVGLKSFL